MKVVVAAGTVGGAGTTIALRAAVVDLVQRGVDLTVVTPTSLPASFSPPGAVRVGRIRAVVGELVGTPRADVYVGFADRLPLLRRGGRVQVLVVQNPHLYERGSGSWGVAKRAKWAVLRRWSQMSSRRADLVVCSTLASRGAFLAATGAPAHRVVVRPIPPPFVGPTKGVHSDRIERVLLVGDVYGYKAFDEAVEAIARFAGVVGRSIEVTHLGGVIERTAGDAFVRAIQAASEAGVVVTRKGSVPHDVVLDEMRATDLVMMTSRAETQGLPLAEALAVGVPILCRAIDVFAEQGGDDVVTVSGGAEEFAVALGRLDHASARRALSERGVARSSSGSGWALLPEDPPSA